MTEPTVWTVNKILQWTQQYFSGKGLENPRLDAEVLLCDVLDCRRIDLFMRLQQELLPEELKKYREFVLRRAAWEPLAYIIGRKTFLQWDFHVTPAVLIPRPETELLVEKLVQYCTGKSLALLEKEAFWRKRRKRPERRQKRQGWFPRKSSGKKRIRSRRRCGSRKWRTGRRWLRRRRSGPACCRRMTEKRNPRAIGVPIFWILAPAAAPFCFPY